MICRAIPYEGNEPYLFISYCHADREQLYPLLEQMAAEGYRLWYDDGNKAGEDWLESIQDHLEQCKACLTFISANSSLSHNCKSEIIYAIKCGKKVIPVLMEETELPKGLALQLAYLHYLKRWEFRSDKEMLKKIGKTKEVEDCKANSAEGLLRPLIQEVPADPPANPSAGAPASMGGILSGLSRMKIAVHSPKTEKKRRVMVEIKEPSRLLREEPVPVPEQEALPEQEPPIQEPPVQEPPIKEPPIQQTPEEKPPVPEDPFDDEGTILKVPADDDSDATVRIRNWSKALLIQPSNASAFVLRKPQTTLGRSPIKCDVAIEGNGSISKHHADIIMLDEKCYLSDAGSTNGTFLNGERLEENSQVLLDNPAVFRLNDETLILVSGGLANRLINRGNVCFLMNEAGTSVRMIDSEPIPLDRYHRWADGTLADLEIHRHAHAAVCPVEAGCILKDENSQNGTYLNGKRLEPGMSQPLATGDWITLGKTTLFYYSISLKGENQ